MNMLIDIHDLLLRWLLIKERARLEVGARGGARRLVLLPTDLYERAKHNRESILSSVLAVDDAALQEIRAQTGSWHPRLGNRASGL